MSARTESIHKLIDFLKVAGALEKTPGFSSLLGLSSSAVAASSCLTFARKPAAVLKFHLPTSQLCLMAQQTPVALSTYLAVIDDVTTWALVLADPTRARPGVSVSLRAEWGPAVGRKESVVEVEAQVIKIGRNLGFTQASVRSTMSGELICFGSHVKYLPMGILGDMALSSYGWPLLKMYSNYLLSPGENTEETNMADAFDSFRVDIENSSASFVPSSIHASLGGPLHGGCQAVLMELAATPIARHHWQRTSASASDVPVRLESMSLEYLSSPKSKDIELRVKPIKQTNHHMTMNVELLSGGRPASTGVLQFISSGPVLTTSEHSKL